VLLQERDTWKKEREGSIKNPNLKMTKARIESQDDGQAQVREEMLVDQAPDLETLLQQIKRPALRIGA
jgi:hypothetical protein